MAEKLSIDQKDWKIIKELKKDSRATVRDIAKKTAIRPSTVHQRIIKLKGNGVIEQFTIKLDNDKSGENFVVFVLVKTEQNLDSRIINSPHVKEVFGVTGEYDLLMKLKFENIDGFNKFILDFRKAPGIKNTVTMVGTINLKEEL